VAFVVLLAGGLIVGEGLERRVASFLERALSKKLGAPVHVGGAGLHWSGFEARDVRIDAAERGAVLVFDRVSVGWSGVEVEGGDIALDEGFVFRKSSVDSSGSDFPASRHGISVFRADRVRFERLSISLTTNGERLQVAMLRGEVARGDDGVQGHVSATFGDGSIDADGRFSAAPDDSGGTRFEGSAGIRALGFEWEPVSRSPINADARIELEGRWDGRNLGVSRGHLRSGRAEVEWSGNLDLSGDRPVAGFEMELRRTDCQNLIDAVPAGVMGEFAGFVLDGTIEGKLGLQLAAGRPDETRLDVSIRDRCRFRKAPPAAELGRLRGPFTHQIRLEDSLLELETGPSSFHWVRLPDVSPFFLHAVLAQEDAQFLSHGGFLPDAFETALARNLEEGRFAAGGSTISMQLARNLFLGREKTLSRKIQEAVLTWWLEKSLSKYEILELYVNLIEFGPRVYGIGPASWHYFGCAPRSLSPAEAAFLATVLPSPSRRHRDYERGSLSSWSQARVEQLLERMWERGRIDQEALSHGLSEAAWLRFHDEAGRRPGRREHFGRAAPLPLS
jgi:hypothetical protein